LQFFVNQVSCKSNRDVVDKSLDGVLAVYIQGCSGVGTRGNGVPTPLFGSHTFLH